MPGKSVAYEQQVLNSERGTSYTAPATMYVGLLTAVPADDSLPGTEVSGNAYARQPCGFGAPTGGDPSVIANASDILFPVQTPGGYGAVVGLGLYDALSAGNLKKWVGISSVTFTAGSQAKFASGSLQSTES